MRDGDDPQHLRALLETYASPGTAIDVAYVDEFEGAEIQRELGQGQRLNGLDHDLVTPAFVAKAIWAQTQGYDAVVSANTFDPAVDAARLAVNIPVIGPFRASLQVASIFSDRLGLVVPLKSHVPYTWRKARAIGMASSIVDIQPLGMYGFDLQGQEAEVRRRTLVLIRDLVDVQGAQGVIPLGGAIFPNLVDPAVLEDEAKVPVYNTKAISIRVAEMCVALGLTQSPLSYPPLRDPNPTPHSS